MIIGERKGNSIWREKRTAKQGKKVAKIRNTSLINGNVSK